MLPVVYGIEKYFLEQGKGPTLETGKRLKGILIPLEMEVAIGKGNGIAVLKGYRYAELAMNIDTPKRGYKNENESFTLAVKIINTSNKPLAIVCPEDNRTFELELVSRINDKGPGEIKSPENKSIPYIQSDIKVLAPESVYDLKIDINSPGYQLQKDGRQISLKDLKVYQTARIRYISPGPEMLKGLKEAQYLWEGSLYSRNFTIHDLSH